MYRKNGHKKKTTPPNKQRYLLYCFRHAPFKTCGWIDRLTSRTIIKGQQYIKTNDKSVIPMDIWHTYGPHTYKLFNRRICVHLLYTFIYSYDEWLIDGNNLCIYYKRYHWYDKDIVWEIIPYIIKASVKVLSTFINSSIESMRCNKNEFAKKTIYSIFQ